MARKPLKPTTLNPAEADLVLRALYTHRDLLVDIIKRHPNKCAAIHLEASEDLKATRQLCKKLEAM